MSWAVVLPGVIWGWGMSLVSGESSREDEEENEGDGEEASRGTHDAAGETPALPISVGGRGALTFLFRASLPRLLQDEDEEEEDCSFEDE